jgi:hypothetical protein
LRILEPRYWEKVNKDGPIPEHRPELENCWEWTAGTDKKGYGLFRLNGKIQRAHRLSYEAVNGETELTLDHLCLNTCCINPQHLEAITREENNKRQAETRLIPQKRVKKEWNPKVKPVFRKFGQNETNIDNDGGNSNPLSPDGR